MANARSRHILATWSSVIRSVFTSPFSCASADLSASTLPSLASASAARAAVAICKPASACVSAPTRFRNGCTRAHAGAARARRSGEPAARGDGGGDGECDCDSDCDCDCEADAREDGVDVMAGSASMAFVSASASSCISSSDNCSSANSAQSGYTSGSSENTRFCRADGRPSSLDAYVRAACTRDTRSCVQSDVSRMMGEPMSFRKLSVSGLESDDDADRLASSELAGSEHADGLRGGVGDAERGDDVRECVRDGDAVPDCDGDAVDVDGSGGEDIPAGCSDGCMPAALVFACGVCTAFTSSESSEASDPSRARGGDGVSGKRGGDGVSGKRGGDGSGGGRGGGEGGEDTS